jgi:hypothetical protein
MDKNPKHAGPISNHIFALMVAGHCFVIAEKCDLGDPSNSSKLI